MMGKVIGIIGMDLRWIMGRVELVDFLFDC